MNALDSRIVTVLNAVTLGLNFFRTRESTVLELYIFSRVLNNRFQGLLDLDVLELYHWWGIGDLGFAWIVLVRRVVSNLSERLLFLLLFWFLLM